MIHVPTNGTVVIILQNTVKFLNFRTIENLAVNYLKFKQEAQTLGYLVKKMPME